MTNEELRDVLLRLSALQDASRQISQDVRQKTDRRGGAVSPLTRELLQSAYARLDNSRDWIVLAMVDVQECLMRDAMAREQQTLAHESTHPMPFVCEFASSIEATVEG